MTHFQRPLIYIGLGLSLGIAALLSPFASRSPDGLDRVSQDLKFDSKTKEHPPAENLPFYHLFEGYQLRGVAEPLATPLAGLTGTLVTFGLAWGMGKLLVKPPSSSESGRVADKNEDSKNCQ